MGKQLRRHAGSRKIRRHLYVTGHFPIPPRGHSEPIQLLNITFDGDGVSAWAGILRLRRRGVKRVRIAPRRNKKPTRHALHSPKTPETVGSRLPRNPVPDQITRTNGEPLNRYDAVVIGPVGASPWGLALVP